MSSNCARVTGMMPCLMRRMPSHQAAAKPTRYIKPYQRTASGPIWNATGSMSGWTSTLGFCQASGLGDEFCRGGAARAAAPGEPDLEHRMPVGEPAIDDAAPSEVSDRARHYGRAQAARDEAHYGLHLNRFLRHVEGEARACRGPANDIVQARRDLARHHDKALAGELAHRERAAGRREAVACRQRGDEALALHDQVLEALRFRHRRQQQTEIQLARGQRERLLRREHLAQRDLHAGPLRLVALQQARQDAAVIRERDKADAQPAALAGGHAAQLEHRALELPERATRLLEQARAGWRELDLAPVADEERHAEPLLEAADGARQRRLGNVQGGGGAAEMQVLGHRDEIPQLP